MARLFIAFNFVTLEIHFYVTSEDVNIQTEWCMESSKHAFAWFVICFCKQENTALHRFVS